MAWISVFYKKFVTLSVIPPVEMKTEGCVMQAHTVHYKILRQW